MKEQFVKKYLLGQKEAFFKNYSVAIKSQNVDAVHDMRVSVKRLSTIIRMLNFNERANFRLKKCFKPVRFVYKQFGGIRDFQVLSELLSEYEEKMGIDFLLLIQKCQQRIQHETKQMQRFTRFFQYQKIKRSFRLVERNLNNIPTDIVSKKIVQYKEDRSKLIKIFSDKSNDYYDLHEVRKLIKDISYLMEMSLLELPEFASELKFYKEIGKTLGVWHDRDVLLIYLNNQLNSKELLNFEFESIFNRIIKEKSELEEECLALLFY